MKTIKIDVEAILKVQILITERSILECEIEAFKTENIRRQGLDESVAYEFDVFLEVAEKLQAVSDKMNILLRTEQKLKGG